MIHIKNIKDWNKNHIGLPRQMFKIDPLFLKKNNYKINKIVPIPWQSKPVFEEKGNAFNVIQENEKKVVSEGLCGYCGVKFLNEDLVVRWKGDDHINPPNDYYGPRVFSDTYPLHIKCMKQARKFCPFMNLRNEKEFEYGKYKQLKQLAELYYKSFGL
jgi:hypothetical protein